MGILKKNHPELPDVTPAVSLEFTTVKKGYDPLEVTQYVEHLLQQHENDLGLVQQRLVEAQRQAREQVEAGEARLVELQTQLDDTKANLEAARSFGGVDPEREAELVAVRGRVHELETELAELKQTGADQDSAKTRALQIKLEEAEKRAVRLEEQLRAEQEQSREHTERLAAARARIAELETQIDGAGEQQGQLKELTNQLTAAQNQLEEQQQLNHSLKDQLSGSTDSAELAEQLAAAQTRNSELERKISGLSAQASSSGQEAELQQEIAELKARIKELQAEHHTGEESALELRHAQQDLQRSERDLERVRQELDKLRSSHEEALREAAKATARVELLEQEARENKQDEEDFGQQARRMMQALHESREQQEREMEREMQLALEEAESVRRRGRQDAERMRLEAMDAVSKIEVQRQQLADEARLRARKVTDDLHEQINELTAAAEARTNAARDSEEQIRASIRQATEVDMWQKTQERDILRTEIDGLTAQRNALLDELAAYRKEFGQLLQNAHAAENGEPMVATPAPNPTAPAEPVLTARPPMPPAAPAAEPPALPVDDLQELPEPDLSQLPAVPGPGLAELAQTHVPEPSREATHWQPPAQPQPPAPVFDAHQSAAPEPVFDASQAPAPEPAFDPGATQPLPAVDPHSVPPVPPVTPPTAAPEPAFDPGATQPLPAVDPHSVPPAPPVTPPTAPTSVPPVVPGQPQILDEDD